MQRWCTFSRLYKFASATIFITFSFVLGWFSRNFTQGSKMSCFTWYSSLNCRRSSTFSTKKIERKNPFMIYIWDAGRPVDIKLCFKIPPALCARLIRRISAVLNSIKRIKFDGNSMSESVAAFLPHVWLVWSHYVRPKCDTIQTSNFCRVASTCNTYFMLMYWACVNLVAAKKKKKLGQSRPNPCYLAGMDSGSIITLLIC